MVLEGLPRAEAVAGGRLALAGPTTAAAGFVRRRRGPGPYKPCPALAETEASVFYPDRGAPGRAEQYLDRSLGLGLRCDAALSQGRVVQRRGEIIVLCPAKLPA